MDERTWYRENFETDVWLRIHRAYWRDNSEEEIAEKVERVLGLSEPSRILDVPCGIGRLSAALADRGHTVHGVDLSAAVLAEAHDHTAGRSDVSFERADMREVAPSGDFDAVVCWWGSFGYFDDEGNEAFLRAVRGALKPGGALLIEGFVTESLFPRFAKSGVFRFDDILVADERHFDMDRSTIESTWTIIEGDSAPTRMRMEVRLYAWLELRRLLERCGFPDTELLASTGDPFLPGTHFRTLVRGHSTPNFTPQK